MLKCFLGAAEPQSNRSAPNDFGAADLQSAVSGRLRSALGFRLSADCKSAIRQIAKLRYERSSSPKETCAICENSQA